MANVGVTFDFAAESAKLRSEIDKVRKELTSINKTTQGIKDGFATMGKAVVAGLSVGAVTAFLSKVNSSVDALGDLSARLGASASGLQSLQLAAELAGGSTEGMNAALAKMTTTIGDALSGNAQAATAFDRLGLSAKQLAALPVDEAFLRIDSALGKVGNTYERASLAQDIYGKGAKDIAGLSGQAAAAAAEVNQRLEEQNARLSKLDVAKIGVMNDELKFQESVVTNLGAKFLSGFAPAIGTVTDTFAELTGGIGGASSAGRTFGVAIVAAAKFAEAAIYGVMEAFNLVQAGVAKVVQFIVGSVSGVLDLLGRAGSALGLDIGLKLQQAGESAATFANNMGRISNVAWERATEAAGNAAGAIVDMFNAGKILDEKTAEFDRKAAEAANRGPTRDAGSAYNPSAARSAGPTAVSREGGFSLSKGLVTGEFDPTLDPAYLQQLDINTALLALHDDFAASRLGQIQALEDSTIGMVLNSAQLQQQIEANKNATMGDMMGNLVGLAMQQGGALGKAGKALAIAQTIWSTGTAVMKAMAEVPFPGNIAAAASVAAMGVAQLANIKKTNVGSGGSVISARGGSAASSPALSDNVSGTQRSTESDQRSAVQIVVQGNLIENGSTAAWLAEILGDAINTRDMVFISPGSRQAAELRGA